MTGSTIASRSVKHLCLLAGCDYHGISVYLYWVFVAHDGDDGDVWFLKEVY